MEGEIHRKKKYRAQWLISCFVNSGKKNTNKKRRCALGKDNTTKDIQLERRGEEQRDRKAKDGDRDNKRWSVTEIVRAFQEQGLEITNIKPIADADRSSLPAEPEEGIRFSISLFKEGIAGCILSFENIDYLEKVRKHYLSLNEKVKLYNWTFAKDNILLVLDGAIPEAKAKGYERALYDLKR